MIDKKKARIRRGRKTSQRIKRQKVNRLVVHRTSQHVYAQVVATEGRVLASASSLDKSLRQENGSNVKAAASVGHLVAERALAAGVDQVAFDRRGFRYHGRVKALAEAAREKGLKF